MHSAPPSSPRAIIFDLSEVLIAGIIGIETALARRVGCEAAHVLRHFAGPHLDELCRGVATEEQYLARVLRESGWKLAPADVAQLLRANFARRIEGMETLLPLLARRHRLVLLSDHGREWIDHIVREHAFLGVFERRIYSYEIGSLKREPGTWERVLRLLELSASECLFVDDSAVNVETASRQGFDAIRFVDAASLRAELRQRGLLPDDEH